MTSPAATCDVEAGVATITLSRPESRNRLDAAGMAQVVEHLESCASDDAVRVVVLTGSGSTFCSGADLAAAASGDQGGFSGSGPMAMVDLLTALLDHPKPTIAKVQGHVAGGGNGLVAACDLAVASADARFAFSEMRLGVAPAVISVVCLQVMHRRDAQELFLTGERVDADRVLRAGLVTSVVPADALDAAVAGYAALLAEAGPEALRQAKDLLTRIPTLPRDAAFAEAARMSAALFSSSEAREGMTAFLEKRPPAWARRL
ncbi:MAG: enoyl-CoA hydratase/isomerase family protein [Actinobacteria bacterium]|nr:enoyl-CoA hydratase/isomerase family protein [Actinomycetota bacterium]